MKFISTITVTIQFIFQICDPTYTLTWMENLSNCLSVVAILFEILRESCKISSNCAPVAVEIIQVKCVWTSACQEGVPTGCTQSLLKQENSIVKITLCNRIYIYHMVKKSPAVKEPNRSSPLQKKHPSKTFPIH